MAETIFKRWNQELTLGGAGILFLLPLLEIQPKIYLTLTIAGLAMGMLLFLVASGVSIIFGLMDVLNFAHGALFAWGAYVGFSVFQFFMKWVEADSVLQNIAVFLLAMAAAMIAVAILGIILERVVVRRVYGNHLFQILITFGATIVLVELIRVFWGPNDEVTTVPLTFSGNWDILDVIVSRYRIICILLGAFVYALIQLILKKTKLGTIVRAGVEDRDMVQAMGHNIYLLFTGVFAVGAGLAALGGVAMSIFSLQVYPDMGGDLSSVRIYRGHHRGVGERDRFPGGRTDRRPQLQLCGVSGPLGRRRGQCPHYDHHSSHPAHRPFSSR